MILDLQKIHICRSYSLNIRKNCFFFIYIRSRIQCRRIKRANHATRLFKAAKSVINFKMFCMFCFNFAIRWNSKIVRKTRIANDVGLIKSTKCPNWYVPTTEIIRAIYRLNIRKDNIRRE